MEQNYLVMTITTKQRDGDPRVEVDLIMSAQTLNRQNTANCYSKVVFSVPVAT